MTQLNELDPAAWTLSLGTTLLDMADQNKLLQQILQMAETNVQLQGTAAIAQGQAQADLAANQASATLQDAYSLIAQGSLSLGSCIVGIGISLAANRQAINLKQTQITNVEGWEKQINLVKGDASQRPQVVAKYIAPGKTLPDANELLGTDVTAKMTDINEQQVALLSVDEDKFEEFADNVANKKKSLEKELEGLQSQRQTWESRVKTVFDGSSQMTQYAFKAKQASIQNDAQAIQMWLAIANYFSQAQNAAAQTMMSQKDQIFNLMISTAQELISGLASSNKV